MRAIIAIAIGVATLGLMTPGLASAEGVTIVMHGWNIAPGEPAWTAEMQNAIANHHLGGEQNFGTITVTGTVGSLTATCNPWPMDLSSSSTGEIVIRIDWSAVANHLTTFRPSLSLSRGHAPPPEVVCAP